MVGPTNSITYNIDWKAISKDYQGAYDVTFTFSSFGIATTTDNIFTPVLEWGADPDSFQPSNIITTSTGARKSLALGFVKALGLGSSTTGYYLTDMNQNPPVRISQKPNSNQFRVKLINPFTGTAMAFGSNNYVMNIRFKAVD